VSARLASLLSIAVLLSTAQADDEKRGYWWKKEPPPADTTPPAHPDLPPPPSEEVLQNMHPADFAKLLDDYKDYALWKMEPQPVTWYYQLQDVARRRSRAFMNVTETVMLEHPDLNMNTVYPTNNAGQAARNAERENSVAARLALERERAALILLTRPSCGFCEAQRAILKHFQQRHGWEIKEINIEAAPQAVARFGTDYTPTTLVIFRGSSDWMPVAVGVESVPRVEESVVRAVRLIRGETTPQQFSVQDFQDGTPLDPLRSPR
jgi:conjugal transfer pilus assembly protein TraF